MGRGAGEGAYLDAVVAVGEVLHGLELLVDDADAGFVGAVHDTLDVGSGLAELLELDVKALGGFDGGLGVEFRWVDVSKHDTKSCSLKEDVPG